MTNPDCLPLDTLHALGKKNFVPLLEAFYFSKYPGFNAFTRKMNMTPKQLSERLHEMEKLHLLVRVGESFELTPKGKEFGELVLHLKEFHSRYHPEVDCQGMLCSECTHRTASSEEK